MVVSKWPVDVFSATDNDDDDDGSLTETWDTEDAIESEKPEK